MSKIHYNKKGKFHFVKIPKNYVNTYGIKAGMKLIFRDEFLIMGKLGLEIELKKK